MRRIKLALAICLLVPTVLWLFADTFFPAPFDYFSFRRNFIQYSGIIAISVMSIAMMLSLRPKWLEPHLDGLDKIYRLHKWLGISALIFSVAHWWWIQGSRWMVDWGWLDKPHRGPRARLGEGAGGHIWPELKTWLTSQKDLAESIGEWAFYIAVIFMVLALIRRFPYHLFISTHRILAITYLFFVYHTIVLMRFAYWNHAIAWFVLALMVGGSYAAIIVLLDKIGASRKVAGHLITVKHYPELQTLKTIIAFDDLWPGHKAGQFAFVQSSKKERPHPYTIASCWDPDNPQITMYIKELGDHTSRLHKKLSIGAAVTVEGPYGHFTFEDEQPIQIWIGAGIGITPFVARLQELAQCPNGKQIVLFHPTGSHHEGAVNQLQRQAESVGVTLYIVEQDKDPLLTGDTIRRLVPEWRSASIWFCGPVNFGETIKKDFKAHGLAPRHFHQELFSMR